MSYIFIIHTCECFPWKCKQYTVGYLPGRKPCSLGIGVWLQAYDLGRLQSCMTASKSVQALGKTHSVTQWQCHIEYDRIWSILAVCTFKLCIPIVIISRPRSSMIEVCTCKPSHYFIPLKANFEFLTVVGLFIVVVAPKQTKKTLSPRKKHYLFEPIQYNICIRKLCKVCITASTTVA